MNEAATKHLDDEASREESAAKERGAFDLGGPAEAGVRFVSDDNRCVRLRHGGTLGAEYPLDVVQHVGDQYAQRRSMSQ